MPGPGAILMTRAEPFYTTKEAKRQNPSVSVRKVMEGVGREHRSCTEPSYSSGGFASIVNIFITQCTDLCR